MERTSFTLKDERIVDLKPYDSVNGICVSDDPRDSMIEIVVSNDTASFVVGAYGLSKNKIKIKTAIDRWDDPGDYPSGAGGWSLPSYYYMYIEDADLCMSKEDILIEILDAPKDEALSHFMNMTEEEIEESIDKCRDLALSMYEEILSCGDRLEEIFENELCVED